MIPAQPIIDSGVALGGRLSWAHVGTAELSNIHFGIDGEFVRTATTDPTTDTVVIGVDVDLVYVSYGREIVRFQRLEDNSVVAIDPVPEAMNRLLSGQHLAQ